MLKGKMEVFYLNGKVFTLKEIREVYLRNIHKPLKSINYVKKLVKEMKNVDCSKRK